MDHAKKCLFYLPVLSQCFFFFVFFVFSSGFFCCCLFFFFFFPSCPFSMLIKTRLHCYISWLLLGQPVYFFLLPKIQKGRLYGLFPYTAGCPCFITSFIST